MPLLYTLTVSVFHHTTNTQFKCFHHLRTWPTLASYLIPRLITTCSISLLAVSWTQCVKITSDTILLHISDYKITRLHTLCQLCPNLASRWDKSLYRVYRERPRSTPGLLLCKVCVCLFLDICAAWNVSWAHEDHNLTQISKDKRNMSLVPSLSQQHVITFSASNWTVDITSDSWLANSTQLVSLTSSLWRLLNTLTDLFFKCPL